MCRPPRRSVRRASLSLLLLSLGLGPFPSAHADSLENVPLGARTAAMGGAAIAGGSDSAMPFLNPAGIARIPGSVFSLSASLYSLGVASIPNFVSDGPTIDSQWGSLSVSQNGTRSSEFSAFPSSVAYFWHLGDKAQPQVLAGALAVPRSIRRRFVQNNEFLGEGVAVKDNLTTIIDEQQYMGSLSWGGQFGRLRIGASLLGAYTSFLRKSDRNDLTVLGTAGFQREQTQEIRSEHSIDAAVLAGLQYDLSDGFRVGASVRTPSIHLGGSFDSSIDHTLVPSDGDTFLSATLAEGDATRAMPLRLGAGIELFGEGWSLALDGQLILPRERDRSRTGTMVTSSVGGENETPDFEGRLEQSTELSRVIRLAVGAEYEFLPTHWARFGLYTDFSAEPAIEDRVQRMTSFQGPVPPELFFDFPIHRYGAALGWGSVVAGVDTTIGANLVYGKGKSLRIAPDSRFSGQATVEATDASLFSAIVFLSAALDLGDTAKGLSQHMSGPGESP